MNLVEKFASFQDTAAGACVFSEPDILTFKKAIYICGWNNFDHIHGIYSQDGYLIPQAAFHFQWPPQIKGQPLWHDPNTASGLPIIKSGIFVGQMHEQYGHFITEFLSRLWVAKQCWDGSQKLIARSVKTKEELFKIKWLREIIEATGFKEDDFYIPDTSFVIENLIVASPLFSEDSICYAGMADYCNSLGTVLASSPFPSPEPANIYLSRSRLLCGTVRIDNEYALEQLLEKRGFTIIHPQELSVSEQVALFRNDNIVVGQVGSAFHTSIFSPSPQGICLRSKVYKGTGTPPALSYRLMDRVNGAGFDYLDFPSLTNSTNPNGNFYETMTLSDLDLAADILVNRVEERRKSFFLSNMGRSSLLEEAKLCAYELKAHNGNYVVGDVRTGQASTYTGSRVVKLLLITRQDQKEGELSFLISSHPDAPAFTITPNRRYGPAIPVYTEFLEDGTLAMRSAENKAYLFACDDSRGQSILSEGPQIMTWEKYTPVETTSHLSERWSRKHAIISLIAMLHYGHRPQNLQYYNYRHPGLVDYISALSGYNRA